MALLGLCIVLVTFASECIQTVAVDSSPDPESKGSESDLTTADRLAAATSACIIELSRNQAWVYANEEAFNALGLAARSMHLQNGKLPEVDDSAISAMMSSSNREAWRQLLENAKAELASSSAAGATPPARYPKAGPYAVHLYSANASTDSEAAAREYRFYAVSTASGGIALAGLPN